MTTWPTCPNCGERFEDDGDRIYTDQCFICGWQTPYRAARNVENENKILEHQCWRELCDLLRAKGIAVNEEHELIDAIKTWGAAKISLQRATDAVDKIQHDTFTEHR